MLYNDTVILVYAKAPVAGKVNTRLIPEIGVQAATELQDELVHKRLSMLSTADLCDVRLMCALNSRDDCFVRCKKKYPISLLEQTGDDLGERMLNGVIDALQDYQYCIVIGTDAPALDSSRIKQAIDILRSNTEVVYVPAEDGGYVLVGLQKPYAFLFQDISWGSSDVMQQSRNRLIENKVSFEELAVCWDIDRIEDYQRYLKSTDKRR
jgi:rSAM/selenodomain-associated transferase 1